MRIGLDHRPFQRMSRYLGIGTYSANLVQALREADAPHEWVPFTPPLSPSRRLDLVHILEVSSFSMDSDRTVVTVYDLIPLVFPRVYLAWHRIHNRNLRGYFRSLKKAHHLIAISQSTQEDLQRYLGIPEERISVIYPGVSPFFRPLKDPAQRTSVLNRHRIHSPFLLYVGSFDYRKNIPGLLRGFALFQKRSKERFQLVLAGKNIGMRVSHVRRYADALGLNGSLRLTGYVPEEDLVALYNAASMLVYPSLYEGFGFPPLEAMACGTPVVTSRNSSLREVTDDSALLVDPENERDLAEAIHRVVLDQGLRQTLTRKGLDRARRFSWEETARQTLALYEQIGAS